MKRVFPPPCPAVFLHLPMPRPASSSSFRDLLLVAAVLLALVAGAVGPALGGPLVLDDEPALALARDIAARGAWSEVWRAGADPGETLRGRPLSAWSFALQAAAGLDSPPALRAGNVLLHGLTALLLALIVRRTLIRLSHPPDRARTTAILAAGAWLLHPLSLSAVVYVVQRTEVLAALGSLAALAAFARSLDGVPVARWRAATVLFCGAAMLAKETAAITPLLLALYDRCFHAPSWRDLLVSRGRFYAVLAATWVPLGVLVAAGRGRGGSAGWDGGVSVKDYLVTQGEAIAGYVLHTVWPHPLVFDHGPVLSSLPAALPAGLAVLALLGAALHGAWRARPLGFAGTAFFLCLSPSSSVVPVASQTIADHRMYLALALPVTFLAVLLVRCLPRAGAAAGAVAITALAVVSGLRHQVYRDEITLWTDTVRTRPSNPRAHHNLGRAEFARGDLAAAERHFTEAERLRPGDPDTRHNLALCHVRAGRHAEARSLLEGVLTAFPEHTAARSALGEVRVELGRVALQAGRRREAGEHYRAATSLRPADPRPWNNLGNVLLELDEAPAALESWRQALAIDADFIEARRATALVLLHSGRATEALPHLERLVRAQPNNAEFRAALAEARRAPAR
ncbi:MAG: repeat-containing protein YrrB [Verrucomicrobiota bacterium]|jgi:Flp pilus assembly protein TadD